MRLAQDKMHITIAGCGPAGMFIAAACARRGLDVAVVAPDLEKPWPNQYGVWLDEFEPLRLSDVIEVVWPRSVVWLGEDQRQTFERPYGVINNDALRDRLARQCHEGQVRFIKAHVSQVEHDSLGSVVSIDDGHQLRTAIFIDATGARGLWLRRRGHGPSAYQTAYGVLAEIEGWRPDPETMIWMDWRSPLAQEPPVAAGPPTFLYGMPMPDGRVFLEETALVRRPEVPFDILRERLMARMEKMGVTIKRIDAVERCRIPMDIPMPALDQRTVGFGGAASMVHPATGYMVAYVARKADHVADVLATHLTPSHSSAAAVSRAAWKALWPEDALRVEALYSFGADVLADFSAGELRNFFSAFFDITGEPWRGFVSRELSPGALSNVMWKVYLQSNPDIRRRLRQASFKQPGRIARGLLGLKLPQLSASMDNAQRQAVEPWRPPSIMQEIS